MNIANYKGGVNAAALFVFMIYLVISLSGILVIFSLYHSESFVSPVLNSISTVSLMYFLFLCLIGVICKRYYFFVFPFVILTVPNAINDLFPNFLMGPGWERNSSAFSFFTHIDLYLIFGVLRFYNDVTVNKKAFSIVVVLLVFFLFLTQVALKYDSKYLGPYFFGLYQVRYFLLTLLIVSIFDMQRDFKYFLWGICLASMILILESFVTSYLRMGGSWQRLGSGNFAVNVYGNLLAALALFVFYGREYVTRKGYEKTLFLIFIFFIIVAMLLTGTKGSVFSLLVSFVILSRYKGFVSKSTYFTFNAVILFFMIIGAYILYLYVDFLMSTNVFDDGYRYDSDTSSMRTRIVLWGITIDMIRDNYVLGIGNGLWNYLKYDYGSPFSVLLDPHNDYLNFVVNYGAIGLVVVFFFYVYPLYKVLLCKGKRYQCNKFLCRSNIVFYSFITPLAISSFSNSNASKHQVFALICFILLCLYRLNNVTDFGKKHIKSAPPNTKALSES